MRIQSPATPRGNPCGRNDVSAHHLVATSAAVTVATTAQKAAALFLRIFLALLAVDAESRVRKRVETIVRDLVAALVALPERFRRAIEATQRFVDVPQEAAFLARHEEHLFALHGVGALVGHVERIRALVPVLVLHALVGPAELLQHTLALVQQPLLEILQLLL